MLKKCANQFIKVAQNIKFILDVCFQIISFFASAVIICLGAIAVMPLLLFVTLFLFLYCVYSLINYGIFLSQHFWLWLKEHLALTATFTCFGWCVIVCGGWHAGVICATIGFVLGVIFSITHDENQHPYRSRSMANNYTPVKYEVVSKNYEKPWSWKGFETGGGPREDEFRMDI